MIRSITLTCLWLNLFVPTIFAQTYPPFTVSAYDSTQSTGYYFLCPYNFANFPTFPVGTQHHLILDSKGDVVYFNNIIGYFAGDFKLHPNGLMSYAGHDKYYLMDSTFTIVDSVTNGNGIGFDLHDIKILPNGHYLLLGIESVTRDLSSYHMFLNNGSPGDSNATVLAAVVQELDAAKNVVFEWHSIDHFAFEEVDSIRLNSTAQVDWTHSNAVEMDYDGNILISHRHFNEITKINRQDSSVMWRLGGKANQFTFIGDSAMFLAQHDCRRLPNGHLTLFDNGIANPLHYGSAKEYILDEVNRTATLVWSHNEGIDHYSASQGNVQRLNNGNTLISYGDLVPTPVVFNVVDSTGNKVFQIDFLTPNITYRTYNFPSLSWELPRPHISCTGTTTPVHLIADSGYSEYLWSNGETTQSILADSLGVYSVYVRLANGGFLSSAKFALTDTSDPCAAVISVDEIVAENFILFPNPASERLTLSNSIEIVSTYEIFDMYGRIMISGLTEKSIRTTIDIQNLTPGIYIFRMGKQQRIFVKQ